jgi:hypothetical protein
MTVSIEVLDSDWGGAVTADIAAVIDSVAACFECALSERPIEAIRVLLNARGRLWAQYAYQFAHELCHVQANFCPPLQHPSKWIEESLCEMSSLFAINSMSHCWHSSPPYPNWKSYAPKLKQYLEDHCSKPEHQVPTGKSFGEWLLSRLHLLRADAFRRADNTIVARELLSIFEQDPNAWCAVRYLNLWNTSQDASIPEFCDRWRQATPSRHHCYTDEVDGRLTSR